MLHKTGNMWILGVAVYGEAKIRCCQRDGVFLASVSAYDDEIVTLSEQNNEPTRLV